MQKIKTIIVIFLAVFAFSLSKAQEVSLDSVSFYQSPKIEGFTGVRYNLSTSHILDWHNKTVEIQITFKNGIQERMVFKCIENTEKHRYRFKEIELDGPIDFSVYFRLKEPLDLNVSIGGMNFFNVCNITTVVKNEEGESWSSNLLNTSNCEE